MLKLCFKKIILCILCSLILMTLNGCAPLIPDNYLGPNTIKTAQKTNGKWIAPRLIPISAKMLMTPEGQELLAPAMRPQPYRIGAFDSLNIIVWGHPEISTVATSVGAIPGVSNETSTLVSGPATSAPILVETDGTIFFPYSGHLKVAGLTVSEVQKKISRKLARYIRNPQVSVQVAKYRNRHVYVDGKVRTPGIQPIDDKPLTLMEAISIAGGIDPGSADPTHIYVIRGSYLRPDVFWLNAQTPQALVMAEQFPLQENDIVYVSAASLTSWNSFVGQILPNFTTYYTIKGLS